MDWTRIPASIDNESARKGIVEALAEAGLAVRIVKERKGTYKTAPYAYFIEYVAEEEKEATEE